MWACACSYFDSTAPPTIRCANSYACCAQGFRLPKAMEQPFITFQGHRYRAVQFYPVRNMTQVCLLLRSHRTFLSSSAAGGRGLLSILLPSVGPIFVCHQGSFIRSQSVHRVSFVWLFVSEKLVVVETACALCVRENEAAGFHSFPPL